MFVLSGVQPASNLVIMTTGSSRERTDAGARIRARRSYLGKSRPDIAAETDNLIYTELQKRVEDGSKKVRTLQARHLAAYLKALDWTAAAFEQETGVVLPEVETMPGAEPFSGGLAVPYYGTVSAGLLSIEAEEHPEQLVALDPILPGLRGRTSRKLGLLRVNGDSMVSMKVADSIPEDSMVLVEWDAAPAPDDIVVAWLDEHSTAVLKQFQEGDGAVLRSFNPRGPVFRGDSGAVIRGVVRLILRKP